MESRGREKRIINNIKKTVGKDKVICALSGGVDSSVVALLVNKAIKKNLICIMVDTGLMRKMNLNIHIFSLKKIWIKCKASKSIQIIFSKIKKYLQS